MILKKMFLLIILPAIFVAVSCFSYGKTESNKQTLIVATEATFPPYEFRSGDKIVGVDIDIMQKVADRLGKKLVVEDTSFSSVIAHVLTGKADAAASGITVTEDRSMKVAFSEPYIEACQLILIPKGSDITGAEMLKNKRIGVQEGTTSCDYLLENIITDKTSSLIFQFPNLSLAVEAMLAGKVDAVVCDQDPARILYANNPDELILLTEPLTQEFYAIAVSKDNLALLDTINEVIREMKLNRELAKSIQKNEDLAKSMNDKNLRNPYKFRSTSVLVVLNPERVAMYLNNPSETAEGFYVQEKSVNQQIETGSYYKPVLTIEENVDNVITLQDKAQDLHIPISQAQDMNPNDLHGPYNVIIQDRSTQKYIALNTERAAMYRESIPELDNFTKKFYSADLSFEQRDSLLANRLQRLALSDREAQYRKRHPDFAGDFKQEILGEVETRYEQLDERERGIIVNALLQFHNSSIKDPQQLDAIESLSPSGKQVLLGQLIDYQERENAVLSLLQYNFSSDWQSDNPRLIEQYLKSIEAVYGMDLSDINAERLKEGGLQDVDYSSLINIFGAVDIYHAFSDLSPEVLASIDDKSPIELQLVKLDYLQKQALEFRGLSTGAEIASVVTNAVPYICLGIVIVLIWRHGKLKRRLKINE